MVSSNPRLAVRISIDTIWSEDHPQLSLDDSPLSPSSDMGLATFGSSPGSGVPDWAICQVLCIFDFESSDPDQLSFNKDEVLTVVKQEESGWWAAMRSDGDRIGWIPSSFVEPLPGIDELQVWDHRQDTPRILEDHREPDIYHSDGHELWVPVFEDVKASSLQVVTPTDLISPYDSENVLPQKHGIDSFFFRSDYDRSLPSLA
ncbi:SH3 domain-containing protein [Scleroderma yunnanense]